MLNLRQLVRIFIFFSGMVLAACVTINIYFPAEKVESVAGEIVNDIRGDDSEENKETDDKGQSYLPTTTMLAALVPSAWAQDATTVSNPTIRTLKGRMRNRYAQLKPWYAKKLLIEGDDGFLATADLKQVGMKERRAVKSLVDAENKDRRQLYREVAKSLNIDPSQVDKVARIFAKEWQATQR